jgi:hypothetical protein
VSVETALACTASNLTRMWTINSHPDTPR